MEICLLYQNKILPEALKYAHPFVNQTTKAINKCKAFIEEMKENDIVVIPNRGLSEITIAVVGKYYEVRISIRLR